MARHCVIRRAQKMHQAQIIGLIDEVLTEFGEKICLEPNGSEADLQTIEQSYFGVGGYFWVLIDRASDTVVGTHSGMPLGQETCTFKRLYLKSEYRGDVWGKLLMQVAVDWASAGGFRQIEFWSDTRFHRAHRFFEKFGFTNTNETRTMNDSHLPYQEIRFELDLGS